MFEYENLMTKERQLNLFAELPVFDFEKFDDKNREFPTVKKVNYLISWRVTTLKLS
jgi:hypothetical protein